MRRTSGGKGSKSSDDRKPSKTDRRKSSNRKSSNRSNDDEKVESESDAAVSNSDVDSEKGNIYNFNMHLNISYTSLVFTKFIILLCAFYYSESSRLR